MFSRFVATLSILTNQAFCISESLVFNLINPVYRSEKKKKTGRQFLKTLSGFLKRLSISTGKLSGVVFSPRTMTLRFSRFVNFHKLSSNQSAIREHCDSIRNEPEKLLKSIF